MPCCAAWSRPRSEASRWSILLTAPTLAAPLATAELAPPPTDAGAAEVAAIVQQLVYIPAEQIADVSRVFANPKLDALPLTQFQLTMVSSLGPNQSYAQEENILPALGWIILPQRGFINVPLGLRTVMARSGQPTAASASSG